MKCITKYILFQHPNVVSNFHTQNKKLQFFFSWGERGGQNILKIHITLNIHKRDKLKSAKNSDL